MSKSTTTPAADAERYDGRVVAGLGVRLAKAGMGLSDALGVKDDWDPHMGDEVTFVIRATTSKVTYERVMADGEDTGLTRKIVTLDVMEAAPMEGKAVEKALRDTAKLVEERKGIMRLPVDPDDDGAEGEGEGE